MWSKKAQQSNPNPEPSSLELDRTPLDQVGSPERNEEFERAAAETESPNGAGPVPVGETAAAEEQIQVNLMGEEIALAIAKFPFSRLAVVHPAWMPPQENLVMLGKHVEGAGNELLEKLLPAAFVKYASQFPATFACLQAFAGVMMMQFFLVRRLQAEEEARRASENGRTVTVPASPIPRADQPFPAGISKIPDGPGTRHAQAVEEAYGI